jgi:glycogen debranching enzyme
MPPQVLLLSLLDNGAPDVPDGFIYLPPPTDPPYVLRFEIEGSSSICRQGSLWVNLPELGERFNKDSFREFKYDLIVFPHVKLTSCIGSIRISIEA